LHSRRPPFFWLVAKEFRELVISRSWWILLLAMGPLVGVSFISAVRTYGEVSGLNGTAACVGEALSPLVGVWAPTFSACELAAVFLLPFVAIRLVGVDRQNGTLKLELQQGMSSIGLIAAKTVVAIAGWLIAMLPALSGIPLWKSYGGSLYPPELATLIFGHVLNASLTIALGAAMASFAEHPSTAAILTLGVTIGTWIVNFAAAIQGGWWERAAGFTPAALVAQFQHGLINLNAILIAVILILSGLGLAAIWMRLGAPLARRISWSIALAGIAAGATFGCSLLRGSWDTSESRSNSFPEADQRALRQIHEPLRIEAHLAQEDPRRLDLENRALSKLRRTIPDVRISYISATSIGLFEQSSAGYGEIWYFLGTRKQMSRATTEEGVLEAIYAVAGVEPPKANEDAIFRGHPLAVRPNGAGLVFFALWPGLILISALLVRTRFR